MRNLVLAAFALSAVVVVAGWAFLLILLIPASWLGLALYARPGAREHAALPVLGGAEAFPVKVDFWFEKRRVGQENGWVAFVDGWLVYEGLRTGFSVRTSDALASSRTWQRVLWMADGSTVEMRPLTDFMQTNRPASIKVRRQFDEAWDEWLKSPETGGEPVFPPHEVSLRRRGERTAEFAVGALALLALSALLGHAGVLPGVVLALAGSAVCAWFATVWWLGLKRALKYGTPSEIPTLHLSSTEPGLDPHREKSSRTLL